MTELKHLRKMKKTLLSIVVLLAITFNIYAQIEPSKAVGKAIRAHGSFSVDPANNAEKLSEALDLIMIATNSDETNKNAKTWLAAGEIYNDVAKNDINAVYLEQKEDLEYPDAALKAFEAFKKAKDFAEKKFETKDALKGIQNSANQLNSLSNVLLSKNDYANAYSSLTAITEIQKVQKENGMKITLDDPVEFNNHQFNRAYCAMQIGNNEEAAKILDELRAANYDDARIYSYGYKIASENEDPAAFAILEEGAKKYPEEQVILFAQINHLIKGGEYDALTGLLKKAIENSPDNPSVYSALGNVYMNLYAEAFDAGEADADKYFTESKSYYEKAAVLDPTLFDVQYSIGSLYYNKAAAINKKMNELPISDTVNFDKYKKEAGEYFNSALPYFKKAEKLNANDPNTLIALKEIYARNNEFEVSNEFKARLEKIQAGETIDSSYFK